MNNRVFRSVMLIALLITSLIFIASCSEPENTNWTPTTPVSNYTASQANGIVAAAIRASTPTVQQSSRHFEAEFNSGTRQWMVTVWSSEEASKEYLGYTYLVDDTTGKILNPPPVYKPD